ncbi:putative non-specific serine/threonine protein kinase [Helianthus annuus]|nr:putative non-specific serine/threonine protein kinase [Helianthus annuus]KAJ0530241.1 putative non-specific serine/threonine protein kinase [Helianthus annuus]
MTSMTKVHLLVYKIVPHFTSTLPPTNFYPKLNTPTLILSSHLFPATGMSLASISGTHILLLSLIVIIMILLLSSQSNPIQILLKFKTNLSNTKIFTSWSEHNPVCNFIGIVCNHANNVKEINLSGQQLAGTVDFGLTCSLELLQKVSLGSNLLHGTISSNLSLCTSLRYLGLENNSFNGQFPWN